MFLVHKKSCRGCKMVLVGASRADTLIFPLCLFGRIKYDNFTDLNCILFYCTFDNRYLQQKDNQYILGSYTLQITSIGLQQMLGFSANFEKKIVGIDRKLHDLQFFLRKVCLPCIFCNPTVKFCSL